MLANCLLYLSINLKKAAFIFASTMTSMNVLVTGCAGFIGSHVAIALLKHGCTVIGLDDFNTSYSPKRKEHNIRLVREQDKQGFFHLHRIDIADAESLHSVFSQNKVDVVVHIAARAGVRASFASPELYDRVNVNGTKNLLELCRTQGVKGFVFGSSSSVYGEAKAPFRESDQGLVQISPYAKSKYSAEQLCWQYAEQSLPVIVLRFFTVYGPRGRPDMAPYKFIKSVMQGRPIDKYGDGSSSRDYTFVSDVARGVVLAADAVGSLENTFEIINIGSSHPVALNDFIKTVEEVVGKKAIINEMPPQKGDVSATSADITKAARLLHWEPTVGLKEGLQHTFEDIRNESA